MFSAVRSAQPLLSRTTARFLASDAAPAAAAAKPASPAALSGGGGLFQRLASFVVGAGVTALGTQFYVYQEIRDGNKAMIARVGALEARLAALEKKK
mmetsp:Transcript_36936/g.110638  ORF Transcript_36936/g.110638 Transcript_36936/m.110638 type:complete len:97 (-) Transcript_36936:634-924(-)